MRLVHEEAGDETYLIRQNKEEAKVLKHGTLSNVLDMKHTSHSFELNS